MNSFKKFLKWLAVGLAVFLVGGFIILFIVREFHFRNLAKTEVEVAKIHNTKLTLDDVMGKNLPPDPGALADATVAGVDANNNGIRDDVELAVFKAYPNSARTRAVLLQYALALQMEATQKIVNTETATAVTQEGDRAYLCIGKILFRDDSDKNVMNQYFKDGDKLRSFVEQKQFNTTERKQAQERFLNNVGSYSSLNRICDIDYSTLPN